MRRLTKIISGGQTGVDQAALRAANDCGLEIGGWCPPGRECEAGIIPAEFPLKETPEERSSEAPDIPRSQRTQWNVRDSDGTLVILPSGASHRGAATDPGTEWTIECAKRYGHPLLICDVNDPKANAKIQQWLNESQVKTLNVAGPTESESPGISDRIYALLSEVFEIRQRTPAK